VVFQPAWRDMELLVFGHAGLPVLVFPTSGGRFFEFEDRSMAASLGGKIDAGQIQLYCVDSVDMESWYNKQVSPRCASHARCSMTITSFTKSCRWCGSRIRTPSSPRWDAALGLPRRQHRLKHPDVFTGFLSMSGAFDLRNFLGGYYDQDCYFNQPMDFLPNLGDPWFSIATAVPATCSPPAGTTSAWGRTNASTPS